MFFLQGCYRFAIGSVCFSYRVAIGFLCCCSEQDIDDFVVRVRIVSE